MTKTISLMLLSVLLLSACVAEPEDTRPGQPVAHRRAAFKSILKAFEPMGVMLRDNKYDARRFQMQADQLLGLRNGPWEYFAPDTLYPPSKSKPEVWSQAEKFATAKQAFLDATEKLGTVAASTTDATEVAKAYKAVEQTCRSCHDDFKK